MFRFTISMVALVVANSMAMAGEIPNSLGGTVVRDSSNNAWVYVVSTDGSSPAIRLQRVADRSPALLLAATSSASATDASKPLPGVMVRDSSNNAWVYVISTKSGSPSIQLQRVAGRSPVSLLAASSLVPAGDFPILQGPRVNNRSPIEWQLMKPDFTGLNDRHIRSIASDLKALDLATNQFEFEVSDDEQAAWNHLTAGLDGMSKSRCERAVNLRVGR